MCENPANIFSLYLKKGTLKVSSDAYSVLLDPTVKLAISARDKRGSDDFTLLERKEVIGALVFYIQRSEMLLEGGQLKRKQGNVKFLPGNRNLAAYAKNGFPVD